jgi:hypothetical protein
MSRSEPRARPWATASTTAAAAPTARGSVVFTRATASRALSRRAGSVGKRHAIGAASMATPLPAVGCAPAKGSAPAAATSLSTVTRKFFPVPRWPPCCPGPFS